MPWMPSRGASLSSSSGQLCRQHSSEHSGVILPALLPLQGVIVPHGRDCMMLE